ncbi:GNAT family N-acetyltransferase [Shimwellia blattae]|uniref:Putative acetyltransferase n=1 Tax=Shimwellia blattae (strain ATCC 29907 / DSM 4481 / JCM 1650 / NBRC 105725 / CDC 9005-74) TaxID=630626 RepID=I2B802_SHIBC|nr:GNAT family N-acetyltransferase [Shimwellia blattae]AFJ46656.1 putative acetyltransferase [Shimwellia blattae DSM 4481 = NBRC 105725]GAB80236.1 putative acetyltransferase [Shimwellia blattae DSM 4481 = NBRC 105725]VDY64130.1 putative acetyltransferase [Shimwellia blattae]VEC22260.1 putative acetyltransferase [Shimwellia blattae]
MNIRPVTQSDFSHWMPLWQQYLDFYQHELPAGVTRSVFERLCAGNEMLGLVATGDDGQLTGLMNLVFHPSTWSLHGYCYVEDLLVAPEYRGQGIARALFAYAGQLADKRQCDRVYWFTQQDNQAARRLYDSIGHQIPFVVYNR